MDQLLEAGMSTLDKLKDDWENLAERDALWAILTDAEKAGGKWDVAEFMDTGEAEIESVMRHLERIGHLPDLRGEALDFGCGVGRLTQPLARRFAKCVGVDISAEMIRKAEALNRFAHCRYVVNTDARLPFAADSFAFIYSNIVLQHVPPQFSTAYLREFVRVLAPGGVLVFGVQDSYARRGVSSQIARARQVLRIRSRIKVAFGINPGDMQMHCLPESLVRHALNSSALTDVQIVDIQLTNTAAKDFNGRLDYLSAPPISGYVGKQYCVVKDTASV
jgi:SAM-dependent methyltransferase